MDNAESLLRKHAESTEDEEGIKQIIEDAKDMGYDTIADFAEKKLADILAKSKLVEETPAFVVEQVVKDGGTPAEIEIRTEQVDQKINVVEPYAEEKIKEVEAQDLEPVPEKAPEKPREQIESEMKQVLKRVKDILKPMLSETYAKRFSGDSKESLASMNFADETLKKVIKILEEARSKEDYIFKLLRGSLSSELERQFKRPFHEDTKELTDIGKAINFLGGEGKGEKGLQFQSAMDEYFELKAQIK